MQQRGHRATLCASEQYREVAEKGGLGFEPILSKAENDELFCHPDFWHPHKTALLCAKWGVRFISRQYEILCRLAEGSNSVIVSNPSVFAAQMVHEKYGIPLANLLLQPWILPSCKAPPLIPGLIFLKSAPPVVWKTVWRGLDLVVSALVQKKYNEIRREEEMPPVSQILSNWLSPQLAIAMFPQWFGEPPTDWPSQLKITSFPLFADATAELPQDLHQFLKEGDAPLAFTFGTGMAHPRRLFEAALGAVQTTGKRAIFLTRFKDQVPGGLPNSVLVTPYAPFDKLFPLCCAVVHHGGIGTVARCLRAGVPQLIRPIAFDQMDNGERVRKLGAGDWLSGKNPSGKQIAEKLNGVLTGEVRKRCSELSKWLEKEKGLEEAAVLIEKLVEESPGIASCVPGKKGKLSGA